MCERERKKERKKEVNVPPSEVTLTSRRAHFLLIASIPISSFTRERASSVTAAVKSAAFTSPPPPPPTPPPHATRYHPDHHHHHSSPPHFSSPPLLFIHSFTITIDVMM